MSTETSCDILDLNVRWDLSDNHIDRNRLSPWPSQSSRMMKEKERKVVQDDPTLPDDSGELSKIKWSGWRFDSQPWNPPPHYLTGKLAKWLHAPRVFPKRKKKEKAKSWSMQAAETRSWPPIIGGSEQGLCQYECKGWSVMACHFDLLSLLTAFAKSHAGSFTEGKAGLTSHTRLRAHHHYTIS